MALDLARPHCPASWPGAGVIALALLLASCADPPPGEGADGQPPDAAPGEARPADLQSIREQDVGQQGDGALTDLGSEGPTDLAPDGLAGSWRQLTDFGPNPGQLELYEYRPANLPAQAPLVVVLHPCEMDAQTFGQRSGWNELAAARGLYLLYPQQVPDNNLSRCFNWFRLVDQARDSGEAASIRQMIAHAQASSPLGSTFVTGFSGGGAMAAALLADYPEVFAGGAIVAGVPAGCAADLNEAFSCMSGSDLLPEVWEQRVRDAHPGYQGDYPPVVLFHGLEDTIVDPLNLTELIEQWATVQGAPLTPASSTSLGEHLREVYQLAPGQPVVTAYRLSGLGHGQPVDPGSAAHQGGQTGPLFFDVDLWAAWYTAEDWGL